MTGLKMELAPKLIDDRLYHFETTPSGVVVVRWRHGFLAVEAVRDIEEYSRHLVAGGVVVRDENPGTGLFRFTGGTQRYAEYGPSREGPYEIVMDRIDSNRLGLRSVGLRITETATIFYIADTCVHPNVVKEYNEYNQGINWRREIWPRPGVDFSELLLRGAGEGLG